MKRYRSPRAALTRTAHTIANDILRIVRGTPGIFMTRIAFASNRTGNWEIWLMDWDGANQTQITNHGVISILPSWAPDNERMVYTSWLKGTSDMWIINRRGRPLQAGQLFLELGDLILKPRYVTRARASTEEREQGDERKEAGSHRVPTMTRCARRFCDHADSFEPVANGRSSP